MSIALARAPARTGLREILAAPLSPAGLWATAHVATGVLVAAVAVPVLVTLLAASVPLMLLALLGLVVLWVAIALCGVLARVEAWRERSFLGVDLTLAPPPRRDGSLPRWMWARTRSRDTWRQVAHAALALPFLHGIAGVLVCAAWGGGLAFLLFPVYGWAMPGGDSLPGWEIGAGGAIALHVVAGATLLLAAPWLARGLAALQVRVARRLLGPREGLSERVEELEETRAGMVAAADAERRRIERDLHDGAQQRIVSVAMTLGRAQARMDDDPEGARRLVAEAHEDAKRALVELRDLARGIYPAVLRDRGLDAALSALAARSPVPVSLEVHVEPRPESAIEAVAYFMVAEALTNVARHSGARRAGVSARRAGDRLVVQVTDDGRGGADPARGSGLAGLRDRVKAVDGVLEVTSREGGPTVVRAELPCAS
jgi:signal transduction histidine kinase